MHSTIVYIYSTTYVWQTTISGLKTENGDRLSPHLSYVLIARYYINVLVLYRTTLQNTYTTIRYTWPLGSITIFATVHIYTWPLEFTQPYWKNLLLWRLTHFCRVWKHCCSTWDTWTINFPFVLHLCTVEWSDFVFFRFLKTYKFLSIKYS